MRERPEVTWGNNCRAAVRLNTPTFPLGTRQVPLYRMCGSQYGSDRMRFEQSSSTIRPEGLVYHCFTDVSQGYRTAINPSVASLQCYYKKVHTYPLCFVYDFCRKCSRHRSLRRLLQLKLPLPARAWDLSTRTHTRLCVFLTVT